MSSPSPWLALLPWLGVVFALLCLWASLRAGRRKRLVDDLPTSKTTGVFIGLAIVRETPLWFVGLVFGRDLLILLFAFFALCFTSVRKFPPTFWGKVSTCLQALAATVFLARAAMPFAPLHWAAAALLWTAAAATAWSGVNYGWRGYRMLRAH